ncbi:hypothetical protein ID866_5799 [Astraeus odoratus]|nr:hypothetical protein ID866_5799 [Astraeus odoratus]
MKHTRLNVFQDADVSFQHNLSDPNSHPYICGWITAGIPCNIPVHVKDLPSHIRNCHVGSSSGKNMIRCEWSGCGIHIRRENLTRHVTEIHLKYRFKCPHCGATFARTKPST